MIQVINCDLFTSSNIQLLYIQRQRTILEEAYRIYQSMCPAHRIDLFDRVQAIPDTRNKNSIVQIKCPKTRYGIKVRNSGGT